MEGICSHHYTNSLNLERITKFASYCYDICKWSRYDTIQYNFKVFFKEKGDKALATVSQHLSTTSNNSSIVQKNWIMLVVVLVIRLRSAVNFTVSSIT